MTSVSEANSSILAMEVKLIKSFSCRELAKSLRVQGSTQPPGSGFVSARTTGGKQDPDYLK
jgi:hypothetical protein